MCTALSRQPCLSQRQRLLKSTHTLLSLVPDHPAMTLPGSTRTTHQGNTENYLQHPLLGRTGSNASFANLARLPLALGLYHTTMTPLPLEKPKPRLFILTSVTSTHNKSQHEDSAYQQRCPATQAYTSVANEVWTTLFRIRNTHWVSVLHCFPHDSTTPTVLASQSAWFLT